MCNDMFVSLFSSHGSEKMSDFARLAAGSLSGATVVTFTCPLDITQARLASAAGRGRKGELYNGIIDCLQKTIKNEGPRAIYKGYLASLAGIIPYTGTQFWAYDKLATAFRDEKGKTSVPMKLLAGALGGAVAQSISYPMDTVRRRLQVQGVTAGKASLYTGTWDCMVKVAKTEGIRGFYRGVIVNALRAGPSQAVQFASYSLLKDLFHVHGDHH